MPQPEAKMATKPDFNNSNQTSSKTNNAGMTGKVISGSLWNIGGQMAVVVASLLATTFVIRFLGTELYGLWALINLIIGYASTADFGMGAASTRFGSTAFAVGDREKESEIVWTSFAVAIIPGTLVSLCLCLFAKPLFHDFLKIPEHLEYQAIWGLSFAVLGFWFRLAGNIFNTPQLVRLRMDINAIIVFGFSVCQVLLTPVAIYFFGGIISAGLTLAVFNFLILLCLFFASQKLLPILIKPKFNPALVKTLLNYGGTLVLSSFAAIILANLEKIILARYASVTALAHYSVAFTLASLLTLLPLAMSQSLIPAFTQVITSNDQLTLESLFEKTTRGNLLWILPVTHFLCVIAKPFFTLWAGTEFGREATIPFFILVAGLTVSILAYVPYSLLMAAGKNALIMRIYWLEIVPYILLAALSVSFLGAKGAAMAWSIRAIIDGVLFFLFAKIVVKNVSQPFLGMGIWYWLSLLLLIISTVLMLQYISSIFLLGGGSIVLIGVYGFIVYGKILKLDEKAWIRGKINYVQQFLNKERFV